MGRANKVKIVIIVDYKDKAKTLESLAKLGYQIKIESERQVNDIVECELIDKYLIAGTTPMTATEIKSYLEELTNESLNINYIGSALKKAEIYKKTMRIDKIAKHVYFVDKVTEKAKEIVCDERMIKFREAQENGWEMKGIKARDFDNPDDFNLAVHAKMEGEKRS